MRVKSAFENWQDGINKAVENAQWSLYDCDIQMAVQEFNRHLGGAPGYIRLDWHLVKAMIWVETGAGNPKWKSSPIQIGNPNDPGLTALLSGKEGGDLILPPIWRPFLTRNNVVTVAKYNIRAGIGYLLMKLANFGFRTVLDEDGGIYEITVKSGDSLSSIAKAHDTTIDILKKMNHDVLIIHPGRVLKYKKSTTEKVIVGFKPVTLVNIAKYYNGGGDPLYARKLEYALAIIRKARVDACSP